jgi:hypothetical protein
MTNKFEPNGIKWILSEALSISINRFKYFAVLTGTVQIPAIILALYCSGLTPQESTYNLILQIISYSITFFAMTLSSALLIAAVGQHYAYNKVTLSFCFTRTWWRILSITTWAMLLTAPLFLITYFSQSIVDNQETSNSLIVIIGITAIILIPFLIYTSFFIQTVIIEGFKSISGIKRSAYLVHGKILKVLLVGILIGLVGLGLSVIVNIPFAILEISESNKGIFAGNNSSIFFYLILFFKNFIETIIILPMLITAGTLLYFDIRSEKENYTINKLLEDMRITSPNHKMDIISTLNN